MQIDLKECIMHRKRRSNSPINSKSHTSHPNLADNHTFCTLTSCKNFPSSSFHSPPPPPPPSTFFFLFFFSWSFPLQARQNCGCVILAFTNEGEEAVEVVVAERKRQRNSNSTRKKNPKMVTSEFLNTSWEKPYAHNGTHPGEFMRCYSLNVVVDNGVWQELNPLAQSLPLFLLQLIIITAFTRLVILLLKPLRQPLIVAEILVNTKHTNTKTMY